MPLKYKNLEASKTAKFNINLLKDQTSGGGSFVTNFSLKSDVFSQIANAIALGAQGNGNTMIADSTPLSNFNKGLTDRIIVNKSNPNVDPADPDKLFDNKYLEAYKKYLQFQIKLTNRSSDLALTLEDIDLFSSYLVDLMKYDLGIYTKNAQLPGTGFIPLNLQLTMDGLSGMKQYQTFDIDETLLPQEYYNKLKFITTVISHKIDTKGWETTINTLGVPKNNDPKTDIQSAPIVETETPAVTKQTVDIEENIVTSNNDTYANQLRTVLNNLGYQEKIKPGSSTGEIDSAGKDITKEIYEAGSKVLQTIKSTYPDLPITITAGRDKFHLARPGSPHNPGVALDFTVGVTNRVKNSTVDPNSYPDNERKTLDNIVNLLKDIKKSGVSISYIDEYRYPSPGSTGGHFHIKAT
jgi:hypothetical protein